jgi:hypothetical protein
MAIQLYPLGNQDFKKIILEKTVQRVIKDTVYIYTTSYNEIDSTYMFRPTISDISAEIVP